MKSYIQQYYLSTFFISATYINTAGNFNILYNLPHKCRHGSPSKFKLYKWNSPSAVKDKKSFFDLVLLNQKLLQTDKVNPATAFYALHNDEFLYK